MKKTITFLVVLTILSFTSCSTPANNQSDEPTIVSIAQSTSESTVATTSTPTPEPSTISTDELIAEPIQEPDIWAGIEIDEYFKLNYDSYDDYLSPHELVDIIELAAEIGAKPKRAISKKMVLIHQTLTTFDSETKKTLLITTDGEIIREYPPEEFNGDYYHSTPYNCEFHGNYIVGNELFTEDGTFIKTLDLIGEIHDSIVIGDETYLISYIDNGYIFFYFLYPDGSAQEWDFKAFFPPHWLCTSMEYGEVASLPVDYTEDCISIGYMSDGLMGVHYVSSLKHYLFYFNKKGELVINLSHDQTPYKVYELGCFKDGEAEIKLIGMDNKNYVAVINTAGEFIGDPCIIDN